MIDFRFHKEPNAEKVNAELKVMVSNPPKTLMDKYPELFNKANK
jgi:hypothetical protein